MSNDVSDQYFSLLLAIGFFQTKINLVHFFVSKKFADRTSRLYVSPTRQTVHSIRSQHIQSPRLNKNTVRVNKLLLIFSFIRLNHTQTAYHRNDDSSYYHDQFKLKIEKKNIYEHSSWLFRTQRATFRLKSGYASRHSLAASTLAGDSSFGSANIDITEINIVSTV